jgi:hypothetical protein
MTLLSIASFFSDLCPSQMNPRDAQRVLTHQEAGLKASLLTLLLAEDRAISDPLPVKSASIERVCEAPFAESASRCASHGIGLPPRPVRGCSKAGLWRGTLCAFVVPRAVLAPWDVRSEKSALRSERPRRKGEGMSSGNEHGSWGKDVVVQWASTPGLVCEVLDPEPAWEQAHSTFLTHAAGRQLCEGWRLVCPQISPSKLCYFFPIL